MSKFKAFANVNFNVTEMPENVFDRLDNIVGKRRKCCFVLRVIKTLDGMVNSYPVYRKISLHISALFFNIFFSFSGFLFFLQPYLFNYLNSVPNNFWDLTKLKGIEHDNINATQKLKFA